MPAGAASLAVCPANPIGLAKAHLQASYGQTQPKLAEFPGLNVIMKSHSWVRSTAKAVSRKKGVPKSGRRWFNAFNVASQRKIWKARATLRKQSAFMRRINRGALNINIERHPCASVPTLPRTFQIPSTSILEAYIVGSPEIDEVACSSPRVSKLWSSRDRRPE